MHGGAAPMSNLETVIIRACSMRDLFLGRHQLPNLKELVIKASGRLELSFTTPTWTISRLNILHVFGRHSSLMDVTWAASRKHLVPWRSAAFCWACLRRAAWAQWEACLMPVPAPCGDPGAVNWWALDHSRAACAVQMWGLLWLPEPGRLHRHLTLLIACAPRLATALEQNPASEIKLLCVTRHSFCCQGRQAGLI